MLFNSIAISALLAAVTVVQVNAHAVFSPPLGKPPGQDGVRDDAGNPGDNRPCAKGNPNDIDKSGFAIASGPNGAFEFTGKAFNGGTDGSTFVTMQIDVTGKGTAFKSIGTVTKNGDEQGKANVVVKMAAELGAGVKCTGGKSGNLCLGLFRGKGGFHNCVAIKQENGGGGGAAAAAPPPPAAPAANPPQAAAAVQAPQAVQGQNQDQKQQGQGQRGQGKGKGKGKGKKTGRVKKIMRFFKKLIFPNGQVKIVPLDGNPQGNRGGKQNGRREFLLPGGRRAVIEDEIVE